ncbi:MAG: septum formation initiator family protein [Candidatus Paceibacterota bacterium]
MSLKRVVTFSILLVVLILIGVELFSMLADAKKLRQEHVEVTQKLQAIEEENKDVEDNQVYYKNPDNLEKSLREKFNYKRSGEIMIIVVPEKQP